MKVSILNASPVGQVQNNAAIDALVEKLKANWDAAKLELSKHGKVTITMINVTGYLLSCVDSLITCANTMLIDVRGADKKATVLAAVGIIYDYIVVQALPFWLKPFSTRLRVLIIDTVMSIAIDWIVSKYNNGVWTPPVVTNPVTPSNS